jgi:flagellar protein FlbD
LINGEKIMVLESCEEVVDRTVAYRARLLGEVERNWPADLVNRAALASAAAGQRAAAAAKPPREPDAFEDDDEGAQRRRRPE